MITEDLQKTLKSNLPQIRFLLKKNPGMAYKEIGEIGKGVGKKYNIELLVNFPHEGKIDDFEMYGKDLIESAILSTKIINLIGKKNPAGFAYELFLDEKGEKISKSKGNG
ncbi:MAG: hypothetical protein VXY27_00940, partial [Thermoproteota archaeon]|nr:hypothetical protein [Thermoproteota archaeon]